MDVSESRITQFLLCFLLISTKKENSVPKWEGIDNTKRKFKSKEVEKLL